MKYYSLKENHLFSKAYRKGRKAVLPSVVVYTLPDYRASELMRANPQKQKINRLGITVAKRIGGAVVRNRTRRIIREAYRLCCKNNNMKKGLLIVIVARDRATGCKSTDIEKDLCRAFTETGVIV